MGLSSIMKLFAIHMGEFRLSKDTLTGLCSQPISLMILGNEIDAP
jgi:hypothetical protein